MARTKTTCRKSTSGVRRSRDVIENTRFVSIDLTQEDGSNVVKNEPKPEAKEDPKPKSDPKPQAKEKSDPKPKTKAPIRYKSIDLTQEDEEVEESKQPTSSVRASLTERFRRLQRNALAEPFEIGSSSDEADDDENSSIVGNQETSTSAAGPAPRPSSSSFNSQQTSYQTTNETTSRAFGNDSSDTLPTGSNELTTTREETQRVEPAASAQPLNLVTSPNRVVQDAAEQVANDIKESPDSARDHPVRASISEKFRLHMRNALAAPIECFDISSSDEADDENSLTVGNQETSASSAGPARISQSSFNSEQTSQQTTTETTSRAYNGDSSDGETLPPACNQLTTREEMEIAEAAVAAFARTLEPATSKAKKVVKKKVSIKLKPRQIDDMSVSSSSTDDEELDLSDDEDSRKKKVLPIEKANPNDRSESFKTKSGKTRYKSGARALKEIRAYQSSTMPIIPRSAFTRLVKQIVDEMKLNLKFQAAAVEALQEAAEVFISNLMEDSSLAAAHATRVTIKPVDFSLVKRIQKNI